MSAPNVTPNLKENWRTRATRSLWTFLTIAAAILFYYLLQHLGRISAFFGAIISALSPIIWGLVIAYLLDPLATYYERKLNKLMADRTRNPEKAGKRSRVIAAFLAFFTAVAFIALLGVLVIPEISSSISGIVKELPSQVDNIMQQLESKTLFDNDTTFGKYANDALLGALGSFEEWLMSDIAAQANVLFSYFYSSVMSVFNLFYNLLIGMLLSIYVMIDKSRFQRQIKQMTYSILPTPTATRFRRMLNRANKKLSGALLGKALDSLLVGVLLFVLISLLNLTPFFEFPYPVLLAVIIGVLNVVPFFGPIVGGFATGLIVLFNNPSMVIWFVLLVLIMQQIDCNYLDPHIVGSSIGLRPFWAILSCLLGSGIFGIIGFVIGPPLFAFVYELISEWSEDRLRAKHLEELFDIPPEEFEDFEDFAEKDENFTGSLFQEETEEDEPEEKEHRITISREKLKQIVHREKKP